MHNNNEYKLMFFDEVATIKELTNLINEKGKETGEFQKLLIDLMKIEKQLKKLLK